MEFQDVDFHLAYLFSNQPELAERFLGFVRDELKAKDTDLQTYHKVISLMEDMAEQLSEIVPPMEVWCTLVETAEEEYMPGGPPISPITDSFFCLWTVSDLALGLANETLGGAVLTMLEESKLGKKAEKVATIVRNIAHSSPRVYEVVSSGPELVLEDVLNGRRFDCRTDSGYEGKPKELWLVRLLPGLKKGSSFLTITSPYVLTGANREEWVESLHAVASTDEQASLDEFLKIGDSRFCWLEFIHQAYAGTRGTAIVLRGLLHLPESRPHSDGRDLAPMHIERLSRGEEYELSFTQGQRKLIAKMLPEYAPRLSPKKTGRMDVTFNLQEIQVLHSMAEHRLATTSGADLRVARDLWDFLSEVIAGLTPIRLDLDEVEPIWSEKSEDVLFRFRLLEAPENVVRYVKVPLHYTLHDLHQVLQTVFGWENSHLHTFDIGEDAYSDPLFRMEDCAPESEIDIEEAFESTSKGLYSYDFGDSWKVSLEILRGYEWGDDLPLLVAGKGPNPVEDCGGIPGFESLLDLLRNPKKKDPDRLRDFVPPDYDPWGFSLEATQVTLDSQFLDSSEPRQKELFDKRYQQPEADFPLSFHHLSQRSLERFIKAAHSFYLQAPWLELTDTQPFLIEGLTPHPLVVIIMGNAGIHYGLSVFEDPESALAMLAGEVDPRTLRNFFFLDFLEGWKAKLLQKEIQERGLTALTDIAPYALTPTVSVEERSFRLVTDVIDLLSQYNLSGPDRQSFGGVSVSWPIAHQALQELQPFSTRPKEKLGRNDPCWCGSGNKYKRCHQGRD